MGVCRFISWHLFLYSSKLQESISVIVSMFLTSSHCNLFLLPSNQQYSLKNILHVLTQQTHFTPHLILLRAASDIPSFLVLLTRLSLFPALNSLLRSSFRECSLRDSLSSHLPVSSHYPMFTVRDSTHCATWKATVRWWSADFFNLGSGFCCWIHPIRPIADLVQIGQAPVAQLPPTQTYTIVYRLFLSLSLWFFSS